MRELKLNKYTGEFHYYDEQEDITVVTKPENGDLVIVTDEISYTYNVKEEDTFKISDHVTIDGLGNTNISDLTLDNTNGTLIVNSNQVMYNNTPLRVEDFQHPNGIIVRITNFPDGGNSVQLTNTTSDEIRTFSNLSETGIYQLRTTGQLTNGATWEGLTAVSSSFLSPRVEYSGNGFDPDFDAIEQRYITQLARQENENN